MSHSQPGGSDPSLCGRRPASRPVGLHLCPPGPGGSGPKAAVPLPPEHNTPIVQFLAV